MWYAISRSKKRFGLFAGYVYAKAKTIEDLNAKLTAEQRQDCYYDRRVK